MHDIESFTSTSLIDLLEKHREIIYDESSCTDESSDTCSFSLDYDYKSFHNDSDSKSLDDNLRVLPDTDDISDNKESPVDCDNMKFEHEDSFSKPSVKIGENLKAGLNNSEEKARKNIKTEETEEELDVLFDSIMQMCDKERKKLDKSAKIVGFELQNEPNNEIKNSSTTKYGKSNETKNPDVLALHEIEPENIFGSTQVLFSDLNAITKETLQDKLLDNQSEAIQNEKKKLYKVNSISSWFKRFFKLKHRI
ncbi:Glycoside hydrolase, family 5 [Nosema bombycis CQ1]|uniref:Glycoside hydrolase, family 5 n=1 Tax=Nosema bombycis (strain CQ1 / CVCC 102059) TaxID=578461 RepID=R0MCI5_NOSB1|nr:Glycoside hydrolase, family 5 [Nosema bombycis CQ1]|eukprot:EOB11760.1 Glycoside hydrolase, family 5 [Nosema bombycis CQ1]